MSLDFEWIGDSLTVNLEDKQLTAKSKTYYEKCKYNGTEYAVGDYVMIANSEADDPESITHCYIASLMYMYEMKSNKKDPFRAQVQWYSRVEQLPKRLRDIQVSPPLNESWELIHEGQKYKGDLSIETIFGKCSVITCDVDEVPASGIGKQKKSWVFFCRFALSPKNSRELWPYFTDSNPLTEPTSNLNGSALKKKLESLSSPVRSTRQLREENDENENQVHTPRSTRRTTRTPLRYVEKEPLPSPLKNATFSATKGKDLRIVIQRCNTVPKVSEPSPVDHSKAKARKKLDMDDTPADTPTKIKDINEKTPKKSTTKRTVAGSATPGSTQKKRFRMTPSLSSRPETIAEPSSPLGEIRRRLHVSAVPQTLPCREDEFNHIYSFVEGKLSDGTGGCMYISGVPGTGKTATVNEVIRMLRECQTEGDLPEFKLVTVNGMKLTAPQQIYVQIWQQLTGNKVTADKAVKLLQSKFSTNGPRNLPTVMIVDELDLLWTKQQDVLYNIFEWPNRPQAQLTVLAIANTMDLPERMLANKVASRMGLTRLTFQPYKVRQLQTIISSRLEGLVSFEPEAVEFIARKVSAASGDARRALDISRRAAELAEKTGNSANNSPSKKGARSSKSTVTMLHVQHAIEEMFSSPKLLAIQACSLHEQFFLNALVQEFNRTGVEECIFNQVIRQHYTLCDLESIPRPNVSELLSVCASLSSSRLILSEHGRNDIRQKVRLNISIDDVTYALKCN